MTWTRATVVVGIVFYLGLCAVALDGASSLFALLVVPPVLVLMIAGGNWLTSYMGLPPRRQHFREPDEDEPHE